MKRIRIKNDIKVSWGITTNGEQTSLEGRNLSINLVVYNFVIPVKDFSVTGNIISFTYKAKEQYRCGIYTLVCQDSTNGEVNTIDRTDAFMLVPHTAEESGYDDENVALEVVQLSTDRSSTSIGKAATVRIGNVESLSPEDFARVTNTGTVNNAVLEFGLPRGKDGLSAYEVARLQGFSGTKDEWLESLRSQLNRVLENINSSDVNDAIPSHGGYLYFDGAKWVWEDKPKYYAIEGSGTGNMGDVDFDYIMSKIEERFLSKAVDDTANGIITFKEAQKFMKAIRLGSFSSESGGDWSLDSEGRSFLTTDYLQVRMKATFETLEILHTDTIGGKLVISPAGSNRILKVEEVYVIYNDITQKAYRCYFLGEQDGAEVQNKWKVGDQARAESFNVKTGTYHKTGNHFYWRLVIGVNSDYVEFDGVKYNYVDLSQLICATGSDAPAPDDVLNQVGSRTDTTRQSCLVFSAVDTYAPCITLYNGIDSFSFSNKEYVEYGVDKSGDTPKAYFHTYGDAYIGDRPTKDNNYEGDSYIKYDSEGKKLTIKAELSIKSTFGGKTLEEQIKGNSLTEAQVNALITNSQVIADLQSQVDGAIETWFYDGAPTLKNEPASNWDTDAKRNIHLGDLYYDNKTGKAYRFAKDGDTYQWTVITDTDITKALADAAKAQETADGKMTVFAKQPTPPYQMGDIWVNATYPSDGSTYKNDILRCQIAKKEGAAFAIADWTLASKYTDDSALDNFKVEYAAQMKSYKKQLDGKVETWYYDYEPTTANAPANEWETEEDKDNHAGDLFYDTTTGYTYRWTGTAWERIKDSDITDAMKAASTAQDTADHKRRVFTSQPTVPYDRGDLWIKDDEDGNGKITYACMLTRQNGSFTVSDWAKANNADLEIFSKTVEESLEGIQDQIDKKAETWYQATDPSTDWTTADEKAEHKSDLWYCTATGKTYYYDGSQWQEQDIPTEVFDLIDGKSSIYVSKPSSYEERDLWILEAAYTLGGTAYTKGELVVATKGNDTFSAADWTKKVKYTDDTVANEALAAAKKTQQDITATQKNLTDLGTTVTSNKASFDSYVSDGYLEPSEIAAMAQDSKRLEDDFAAAEKSYDEVKDSSVLKDTSYLTDLKDAFATFKTAKVELVTYLSDIATRYNAADADGKKTIVAKVGTLFSNFQSTYSTFYDKLGLANAYLTSKIVGDLNTVIGDVSTYNYLKEALKSGATTDIKGGLILSSLIALRDPSTGYVQSGINGIVDSTAKGNGIATWWGGYMNDGDVVGFEKNDDITKQAATSLIRFDGSGYLAGGAIYWGTDGKVHADPTSFIISEKNLGAYLTFFEPTWKSGSEGTSISDLVSLTPNAPFTKLGIGGDLTVEGKVTINGIEITYDATNKALKIDGSVYATGGITAYGAGSADGGGGLNGTIIPYASAIKLTEQNEGTQIASAWSVRQLYQAIQNIDVTGQLGDYLTIASAKETYQPKGDYLTSHQSIYGLTIQKNGTEVGIYTPNSKAATIDIGVPTKVSELTNDSGFTTNKGTVTSVSITLPTGLTLGATKTITSSGTFAISFTSGYSIPTTAKQTAWDEAVSAKHSHDNKTTLNGITDTKVTHWDSAYDWYTLMTTDEETADGVINKWNEVVSFLAGISQADTLDGIVDGINTAISDEAKRAKAAEGANATNITTLQGYFSSGSAKKAVQLTTARKLWGNSFNGTADISGSIVVPSGKYISIGNIKLEYDATNKALKITNTTTSEVANIYASGGVSAYGVGTTGSSGGGLNGSVKSYADAIKLESESLSEIASAYSIKQLDARISSLENGGFISSVAWADITGKPTTLSGYGITDAASSSHTHTNIGDGTNKIYAEYNNETNFGGTNGSTTQYFSYRAKDSKSIVDTFVFGGASGSSKLKAAKYIVKGGTSAQFLKADGSLDSSSYLTSHQSLDGYVNALTQPSGSNVFVTAISKNGKTLSYTKSYTKKSLTSVGTSGWTNASTDSNIIPDMSFIAYWNGAYSGTSSNLAYCCKGAFGSFATRNSLAFTELSSHPTTLSGYGITDAASSGHTHDLLHYSLAKTIDNTTTDNGWSMINDDYNGHILKSLRMQGAAPNWLCSNYSAGIAFGGADTKGVLSVAYDGPTIKFAGGNGSKPVWYLGLTGTSGYTYNLNSFLTSHQSLAGYATTSWVSGNYLPLNGNASTASYASSAGNADTVDGLHESSFFRNRAVTDIDQCGTLWSQIGIREYWNALPDDLSGVYNYGEVLSFPGIFARFDIYIPHNGTEGSGIWMRSGWDNDKKAWKCVAFTDGNVASATKLQTSRSIWGNSFDGTGDVSGTLCIEAPSPGNFSEGIRINANDGCWTTITLGTTGTVGTRENAWSIHRKNDNNFAISRNSSDGVNGLVMTRSGMGLGTTSPSYRLDVNGKARIGDLTPYDGINSVPFAVASSSPAANWQASFGTSAGSVLLGYRNTYGIIGNSGAKSNLVLQPDGGNVGIGENPQCRFAVAGGAIDIYDYGEYSGMIGLNRKSATGGKYNANLEGWQIQNHNSIIEWYVESRGVVFWMYNDGSMVASGGITAYSSSDIRLKHGLERLDYLGIIRMMGGTYGFAWNKDNARSIGWIAQHVMHNPWMRDLVETDEDGYYKINYWSPKLIATAFGAIEQVDDELSRLKARVTFLESEVERLTEGGLKMLEQKAQKLLESKAG